MLSKIYLKGGDFLWIVGFTGPVACWIHWSSGFLDSLVQWIFGFTGPVDCWIHWSSGFTRFTGPVDQKIKMRMKLTITIPAGVAAGNKRVRRLAYLRIHCSRPSCPYRQQSHCSMLASPSRPRSRCSRRVYPCHLWITVANMTT